MGPAEFVTYISSSPSPLKSPAEATALPQLSEGAEPAEPAEGSEGEPAEPAGEPTEGAEPAEGSSEEGELFVCGRLKDMVIVAGKNHYSEDMELSIAEELHGLLRPGRIAAISASKHDAEASNNRS